MVDFSHKSRIYDLADVFIAGPLTDAATELLESNFAETMRAKGTTAIRVARAVGFTARNIDPSQFVERSLATADMVVASGVGLAATLGREAMELVQDFRNGDEVKEDE